MDWYWKRKIGKTNFYINVSLQELDQDKLTPLFKLRYHNSLPDTMADLGASAAIKKIFVGL